MDRKEFVKKLGKIIERRVELELSKRVEGIRESVLKEVSTLLYHTKNEILQEVSNAPSNSDFDTALKNISNIPYLKENLVDKLERPKIQPKRQWKKYTSDPMINKILNGTEPFSEDDGVGDSVLDQMFPTNNTIVGENDIPKVFTNRQTRQEKITVTEDIEGNPVDVNNPKVKSVMDLMNRDYSQVLQKAEEKSKQKRT